MDVKKRTERRFGIQVLKKGKKLENNSLLFKVLNVTLDLSRLKLGQILIGKTNLIIKKKVRKV